jgi:hypothetical protein
MENFHMDVHQYRPVFCVTLKQQAKKKYHSPLDCALHYIHNAQAVLSGVLHRLRQVSRNLLKPYSTPLAKSPSNCKLCFLASAIENNNTEAG